MGSKAVVFLGLFLAIFLIISSEVAARELAETSNSVKLDEENTVNVEHYYGGKPKKCRKCCYKYKYKYKCGCCHSEEYVAMGKENVETQN